MRFDPDYLSRFYDQYDLAEWERLEASAYGRLQAIIHTDFVREYVQGGNVVADIGSGPGRFSIEVARLGATPILVDISPQQLKRAGERLSEAGFSAEVIQADMRDLSCLSSESFDTTICFGGALSYVCDDSAQAVAELMRITKPGGFILASVMSIWGYHCNIVRRGDSADLDVLANPDERNVDGVALYNVFETGDLAGFSSSTISLRHPPMHLFTAEELRGLFPGSDVQRMAGSNVTAYEGSEALERAAADPQAWDTIVKLERRLCTEPGLVDSGSHIIIAVQTQWRPAR